MNALPLEPNVSSSTHSKLTMVSLSVFLAVTFIFTWSLLGLTALPANQLIALSLPSTVMITLATLGLALGAIAAAAYVSGRTSVRTLLAQAGHWRVGWKWFGIVLVGPALFEEIGWRGFALPRLQSRYGWLLSSLILGVIWAVWHAPIWFIPEAGFSSLPFPIFLLFTIALSLLMTWLYNRTGGSVLLPALAHAAINAYPLPWNTAVSLLPESARGLHLQIPVTIILVIAAIFLVTRTGVTTSEKQ